MEFFCNSFNNPITFSLLLLTYYVIFVMMFFYGLICGYCISSGLQRLSTYVATKILRQLNNQFSPGFNWMDYAYVIFHVIFWCHSISEETLCLKASQKALSSVAVMFHCEEVWLTRWWVCCSNATATICLRTADFTSSLHSCRLVSGVITLCWVVWSCNCIVRPTNV